LENWRETYTITKTFGITPNLKLYKSSWNFGEVHGSPIYWAGLNIVVITTYYYLIGGVLHFQWLVLVQVADEQTRFTDLRRLLPGRGCHYRLFDSGWLPYFAAVYSAKPNRILPHYKTHFASLRFTLPKYSFAMRNFFKS
jgi:hypothetical protein